MRLVALKALHITADSSRQLEMVILSHVFKVIPGKSVLVVVSHDEDKIALTWLQIEIQEKLTVVEYRT